MPVEGSLGRGKKTAVEEVYDSGDGNGTRIWKAYIHFPRELDILTGMETALRNNYTVHPTRLLDIIPLSGFSWREDKRAICGDYLLLPTSLADNVNACSFYGQFIRGRETKGIPDCFILNGYFYTIPEQQSTESPEEKLRMPNKPEQFHPAVTSQANRTAVVQSMPPGLSPHDRIKWAIEEKKRAEAAAAEKFRGGVGPGTKR